MGERKGTIVGVYVDADAEGCVGAQLLVEEGEAGRAGHAVHDGNKASIDRHICRRLRKSCPQKAAGSWLCVRRSVGRAASYTPQEDVDGRGPVHCKAEWTGLVPIHADQKPPQVLIARANLSAGPITIKLGACLHADDRLSCAIARERR